MEQTFTQEQSFHNIGFLVQIMHVHTDIVTGNRLPVSMLSERGRNNVSGTYWLDWSGYKENPTFTTRSKCPRSQSRVVGVYGLTTSTPSESKPLQMELTK